MTDFLLTCGQPRPFWVGTVLDKPIIFLYPTILFIMQIPSLMLNIIQLTIGNIMSMMSYLYLFVFLFLLWLFFFGLTLLWEPMIGLMIQIIAPLLTIVLLEVVFYANILLFVWYIFLDVWNAMAPLITLIVIFYVRMQLKFLHMIVNALGEIDLTALVEEFYELVWFVVDIFLDMCFVLISVLPSALYLMAQVFGTVFMLYFEIVSYIQVYTLWSATTLFPIMFKILPAVNALVRHFRSLIKGRLRSDGGGGGGSGLYSDGTQIFFDALYEHGGSYNWQEQIDLLGDTIIKIQAKPSYTIKYGPVHAEMHGRRRTFDVGDPEAKDRAEEPRRMLHTRFRKNPHDPLYFKTHNADEHHYNQTLGLTYNVGDRRRSDSKVARALDERQNRMGHVLYSMREAMHSGIDALPSSQTQIDVVQSAAGRICAGVLGFKDCKDALNTYHKNSRNPLAVLEALVPDVTQHPVGVRMLEANPAENRDHRMWWHEWRKTNKPVSGFKRDVELNQMLNARNARRAIETTEPETGISEEKPPDPADVEIASIADCFTTSPRNILCIPQFPPRGWYFPFIKFEVPVDLSRDCDVFIPPPTPKADGTVEVIQMFNPITIFWNTVTWFRYLIGFPVTTISIFDATALRWPGLSFVKRIAVWDDPRKTPPNTEKAICMFVYTYYPVTTLLVIFFLLIIAPTTYNALKNIYGFLSGSFAVWRVWQDRLNGWYLENDPRLYRSKVLPSEHVADQFFIAPSAADGMPVGKTQVAFVNKGEVRAGDTEFQKLVGAGVDADVQADFAAEASDTNTLLAGGPAPQRQQQNIPNSALVYHTMIEPRLLAARKEYNAASDKLQKYLNKANELGLLDPRIRSPTMIDARRMKIFHGTEPMGSYETTISYLEDFMHNWHAHLAGKAPHEFRLLPHPTTEECLRKF